MDTAVNAYQKNQVKTISQEKLVLMLYDGAIRFLTKASDAIEKKDIQEAHKNLIRSQDIVAELIAGLNFDAGQIAENLHALYDYMHRRLIEANTKKDKEIVTEVLGMIKELRETWIEAINNSKKNVSGDEQKSVNASR